MGCLPAVISVLAMPPPVKAARRAGRKMLSVIIVVDGRSDAVVLNVVILNRLREYKRELYCKKARCPKKREYACVCDEEKRRERKTNRRRVEGQDQDGTEHDKTEKDRSELRRPRRGSHGPNTECESSRWQEKPTVTCLAGSQGKTHPQHGLVPAKESHLDSSGI